jgi:hypothetical protein
MRDRLNSNPVLQVVVIGVLLVGTGFFVLSSMGRGGEEESESSEASTTTTVTATVTPADTATPAAAAAAALSLVNGAVSDAPSPPRSVVAAWDANKTVVLLFVRDGGIDDHLVAVAVRRLSSMSHVATFVVPARQIARYAAITEGVGVERVPALVVVRPKHLDQVMPTASVSYGFQSPESVVQEVVDASYKGHTVDYHP